MQIPRDVIFEVVRGFRGRSRNCIKIARVRAMKALLYSYIMRRQRQRRYRVFWIGRINAAGREWSFPYAWLSTSLWRQNIWLDRKMLANIAETEPATFKALVNEGKRVYFWTPAKVRDISDL
ncbi:ribosomal protein l20 [Cystoisospora suis]|uniref:Ribosomal protein l20 n=1 Tax=Cystoisospora suis TaxID=483139 RepID=A0A2C6KP98_9APIC|nr:ribosomal protein l20 [Cystoisospora suis]